MEKICFGQSAIKPVLTNKFKKKGSVWKFDRRKNLAKYWNAEMTLDKWLSKNYKPYKSSKTGTIQRSNLYKGSLEKEITMEQWERARIQAAIIVNKYGEDYLPIFNHVELQIKQRKSKDDSLKRIENILAQHSPKSLESNLL